MLLLSLPGYTSAQGGPPVYDLAWSPDGTRLIVVGAEVRLYNAELDLIDSTADRSIVDPFLRSVAVSWRPNGGESSYFVTVEDFTPRPDADNQARYGLTIWDCATFEQVATIEYPGTERVVTGPVYWAAGDTIFAAGWQQEPFTNRVITAWNVFAANGTAQGPGLTLAIEEGETFTVDQETGYIPQGGYTVTDDGETMLYSWVRYDPAAYSLRIFDRESGATRDIEIADAGLLALNRDETQVAIGGLSTLAIYDLTTGELLRTLFETDPAVRVDDLAWSPDDRYLAVITQGDLLLYDAMTGQLAQTLHDENSDFAGGAYALDWHPSGDRLTVVFWDGRLQSYPM